MGENAPPPSEQAGGPVPAKGPPLPLLSEALHARFEDPVWNMARVDKMRPVWSLVGRRRAAYFTSLALTLTLVLMPVWDGWIGTPPILASGHGILGQTIAALGLFLPGFLMGVVESWANNPFWVVLLLGGLFISNLYASRLERRLRDETRGIWNWMIDLSSTETPKPAQAHGTGSKRKALHFARWRLAPFLIFLALLGFGLWLLTTAVTRISLAFAERGHSLCASAPSPEKISSTFRFDTLGTCHSAHLTVERNKRYVVEMLVDNPWFDGRSAADPRGLSARQIGFAGYLGAPLRRAVSANYLQPVVHIRGGTAGPALRPLALKRGPLNHLWRGEFVADRTGALSVFANESVLPFAMFGRPVATFYTDNPGRNQGSAVVRVTRADTVAGR
jgi:hypothetical protein